MANPRQRNNTNKPHSTSSAAG